MYICLYICNNKVYIRLTYYKQSMSAQDRETLAAAAQARANHESNPVTAEGNASIAETAVHPPTNHMEVDDLERELSGAV